MGKSKRKKAPGNNDVTALPSAVKERQRHEQLAKAPAPAEITTSTPGRGEAISPWPQQLPGKSRHGASGDSGSAHHLPTITRGPEALRQMRHHNNSPVQQTPANQAAAARIEHLSQIAKWAATEKIPSLEAFYGERLASACQSAGIPSPVLSSQCERCEMVLLPGVNCSSTVALKKRNKNGRKGKSVEVMPSVHTVVHRCPNCKYRNRKRRVPRGDVKTKLAEAAARAQMKNAAASSSLPNASVFPLTPDHIQGMMAASPDGSLSSPVTPAGSQPAASTPASAFQVDQSFNSSSKKRKRKPWTGLKAMSKSLQNRELPIPERLGFAVDFNSPLNPAKESSI